MAKFYLFTSVNKPLMRCKLALMKIQLGKIFSGLVLITVLFNAIIHSLALKSIINPSGMSAAMTLFTSLSLALLALSFFLESKPLIQRRLYLLSIATQGLSLCILVSGRNCHIPYFQCSSLPTSIFIITAATLFYMENIKKLSPTLTQMIGPSLLFISSFFVFAYISEASFFLGIIEERIGVGLSLYSIIGFTFLSTAAKFHYSKLINLDQFNITVRPSVLYTLHICFSVINFLLLFIDLKMAIFSSLVLQTVSLSVCYLCFVKPFQKSPTKFVTICSWTRKIRDDEGNWHSIEEVLDSLGVSVTHGISPEALENINRTSTISKATSEKKV